MLLTWNFLAVFPQLEKNGLKMFPVTPRNIVNASVVCLFVSPQLFSTQSRSRTQNSFLHEGFGLDLQQLGTKVSNEPPTHTQAFLRIFLPAHPIFVYHDSPYLHWRALRSNSNGL